MKPWKPSYNLLSKTAIIMACLFCITCYKLNAQDNYFLNYWKAPMIFNPALIGSQALNDSWNASFLYKTDHWGSGAGSVYNTSAANIERRSAAEDNPVAFGLSLVHLSSSSNVFQNNSLQLGVSKKVQLNRYNYLLGGMNAVTTNSYISAAYVTTQDQLLNFGFGPGVSMDPAVSSSSFFYFDYSAGMAYQYAKNGVSARLGLAVFHPGSPNVQAKTGKSVLSVAPRWVYDGELSFMNPQRNREFTIRSFVQKQDIFSVTCIGAAYNWIFSKPDSASNRRQAFNIGFYTRLGDMMYATAGMEYKNVKVDLSYGFINNGKSNPVFSYSSELSISINFWKLKKKAIVDVQ